VNSATGVATIVSETTAAPSQVTASEYIEGLGLRARNAARKLASATTEQKNQALVAAAAALRERMDKLIAANRIDVQNALAADQPDAFIDRLTLDPVRIDAIAAALEDIAALPDPVGRVLMETIRPNGLEIRRVATPLGVIGMIYESRPNVGADAGALCLKSGNAVILRGGSDSLHSTRVIVAAMAEGLTVPQVCLSTVFNWSTQRIARLLRRCCAASSTWTSSYPVAARALSASFANRPRFRRCFISMATAIAMCTALPTLKKPLR
jgi:glutamate-5-semialdehyde dehydrogenase